MSHVPEKRIASGRAGMRETYQASRSWVGKGGEGGGSGEEGEPEEATEVEEEEEEEEGRQNGKGGRGVVERCYNEVSFSPYGASEQVRLPFVHRPEAGLQEDFEP